MVPSTPSRKCVPGSSLTLSLVILYSFSLASLSRALPAPRSPVSSPPESPIPLAVTATVSPIPTALNTPLFGTIEAQRRPLGGNVLGPNNVALDSENPELLAPPTTDHGTVKNVKWPFSLSHNRLQTGGWARQQNVNKLPVATGIAGVEMRLEPGAYREMHWHSTAEWAYIIKGGARISVTTPEGKIYISDVNRGDLWYFPPGFPHSIQALGAPDCPDVEEGTTAGTACDYSEGTEFLLVFDDGSFNEDETFLLTDWLAHVPLSALAKNFGVRPEELRNLPGRELYIFPSSPPPATIEEASGKAPPQPYTYAFSKVEARRAPGGGGTYKIADSRAFEVAKTIAVAEVTVDVGAMRELHWHPTQPEWTYYLEGQARMTVFAATSNAQTFDFQAGDVGYITPSFGHYIENTGNTTLKFLEISKTDIFQDVSLQQWLALTPHEVVKAHLGLSDETIAGFNTEKLVVV